MGVDNLLLKFPTKGRHYLKDADITRKGASRSHFTVDGVDLPDLAFEGSALFGS